jgi:hypothetical protein
MPEAEAMASDSRLREARDCHGWPDGARAEAPDCPGQERPPSHLSFPTERSEERESMLSRQDRPLLEFPPACWRRRRE